MAELKSCPFCGVVPKAVWNQGASLPHLIIRHNRQSDCVLEMSILVFAENEDAAIEKWNRRFDLG